MENCACNNNLQQQKPLHKKWPWSREVPMWTYNCLQLSSTTEYIRSTLKFMSLYESFLKFVPNSMSNGSGPAAICSSLEYHIMWHVFSSAHLRYVIDFPKYVPSAKSRPVLTRIIKSGNLMWKDHIVHLDTALPKLFKVVLRDGMHSV